MDFGVVVGLDGLGASSSVPETTNKHKWYGSEFLNQDWRTSKLPKTAHDNYNSTCKANNANLLRSDTTTLFSSDAHQHQHQHQMLSYSSPKLQGHNATFSAYNRNSSTASVQTGRADVSVSGGGMHGILSGVRGPFTPSQWMELEHQALIYKYISANVPIPYNLLIPIRKALDSAGFSTFTAALLRPNTFGWGSFHYGFSSNTDLEPGRCRRTDGKKWRCSRDAVAEQKYCERHMNRGRHRSRKPVEGQTKHLNNNNRMYMNKEEVVERIQDLPSPTIDAKSKENPFLVLKQQNPFDHSSRTEFGHVSSDSLLNPSNKTSTLTNCLARDCDPSAISWPELSISIPTTSCPNNDNVTLSSLRLSREFDPIQTSLIPLNNEPSNRQANWIPISWGTSMGGPLGEVLHNSTMECKNLSELNFIGAEWDNSPRLGVGSSSTGVLQKTAFGSLSSSSAGSSPRAENNRTTHQGTSLCNDLFDTIRSVNPSAALPAL